MHEIYLTKLDTDKLPVMDIANLKDGYSSTPNGLFYDSYGVVAGKRDVFNFDDKIQYPIAIESTQDNEDEKQQNQTDRLIGLIINSPAKLFHDDKLNAMIAVNGDGSKILRIHSKDFKTWLSHLWWDKFKKGIGGQIIETAARTLEGQAIHDGERIELHNRIAEFGGNWYYDLGEGRVVEISNNGWSIMQAPPILFHHYSHQKPQAEPQRGWEIEKIYEYLPYPENQLEKLLLVLWLITAFIPDLYHPILLLHGEQGSRKTTLFKLFRSLIDPSILETITLRSDLAEFVQQASHNYFLPLDNLTHLKSEMSDLLCRVVTGEGFSKRELHSDDSDIIYAFQRVVGINGINLVADKPDLLDRSIILKLMPPEKYQTENSMFGQFNEAKPKLIGAILDTLVKTKQEISKMPEEMESLDKFRMAGFARHAVAIGKALNLPDQQVTNALNYNRQRQHGHVLDSSVLLQIILKFMEAQESWEGTPAKLFSELKTKAVEENVETKHSTFPQSGNWVTRRINELLPTLRAQGIEFDEKHGTDRIIILTNKNLKSAVDVDGGVLKTNQKDSNDVKDSIFTYN